jgi:hypothetical protein
VSLTPYGAAAELAEVIRAGRYRYANERDLQDGIAQALAHHATHQVRAEVALTPADRIDFLVDVDGRHVGIEVKVDRRYAADRVLAQLRRYAASDEVDALLLITTVPQHTSVPAMVGGKPLYAHFLRGI